MRHLVRNAGFRLLRRIAQSEEAQAILGEALGTWPNDPLPPRLGTNRSVPYDDLEAEPAPPLPALSERPVFITARFRSGSTLLWNLFRHLDGWTAYYEPFNERRWFDREHRGKRVDSSHIHVDDYWAEYDGLAEKLGPYYSEEWTRSHLFMGPRSQNQGMKRYVETLLREAPGRPALQFNRIDFRLPWIRFNFPGAYLLHLYRHPRDQWISTLMGRSVPADGTLRGFAEHDGYYLLTWARDLARLIPILERPEEEHPYTLFYLIWKLSYLFGQYYADLSISFESLVTTPRETMETVLSSVRVGPKQVDPFADLVTVPTMGRWRSYANAKWFSAHESVAESSLEWFFQSLHQC